MKSLTRTIPTGHNPSGFHAGDAGFVHLVEHAAIHVGEDVERSFPIHTPMIAKIEVVTRGKVRRAKLHYLRDRVGKEAVTMKAIR